jgi:hypothetical protein
VDIKESYCGIFKPYLVGHCNLDNQFTKLISTFNLKVKVITTTALVYQKWVLTIGLYIS